MKVITNNPGQASVCEVSHLQMVFHPPAKLIQQTTQCFKHFQGWIIIKRQVLGYESENS